jgi:serine O-acetyltransferase
MNVKIIIKNIWLLLSSIRLIPHICFINKEVVKLDLKRWSSILLDKKPDTTCNNIYSFIELMTYYPEYRSLFYYRLKFIGKILSPLCPSMSTLYIDTQNIAPGLFIQHGFATIIAANKIGTNCWINQQVTIGFSNDTDCPTIGDNVIINAGAKVIGNIKIGDNVRIGANAVVIKDVPENCTVVGVPAYIVRRNGVKTKEAL